MATTAAIKWHQNNMMSREWFETEVGFNRTRSVRLAVGREQFSGG